MSSKGNKPWWEKTFDTSNERVEFMRSVGGATGPQKNNVILAVIAGYVGGRLLAKRKSDKQ